VELVAIAPAPVLCPPHHWLIEGSNTRAGHQDWTCYRCGMVRAHEDIPRSAWSYNIRYAKRPQPAVTPEGDAAVAG
jgi:hypothetical protein